MNRYTLAAFATLTFVGVTQARAAQPPSDAINVPMPAPLPIPGASMEARQTLSQPKDPRFCYLADKAYSQGAVAEGLVCTNEATMVGDLDMRWEAPRPQKK